MSGFNVSVIHPDYQDYLEEWEIVRDCISGERIIKRKSQKYLPMPSVNCDTKRYLSYISRAVFYNATARTRDALAGAVFSKAPQIKLPELMQWAQSDIDGKGTDLIDFTRFCFNEVLTVGRIGLLADYNSTSSATLAQLQNGDVHPVLYPYVAENIINWYEEIVDNKLIMTQVVLREVVSSRNSDNPFRFDKYYQYRVLYLDQDMNYNVDVYRDKQPLQYLRQDEILIQTPNPVFQDLISTSMPKDKNGNPLKYIPFKFGGSERNQSDVQKSPLIDLARMNLSHYRTSADVEEMLHITAVPTLILTGVTNSWVKEMGIKKIALGSTTCIPLPEGATASLLQLDPTQLLTTELRAKETQMQMLGARIMQQSAGEAAETVRMRQSGEASVLEGIALNVSALIEQMLEICTDFQPINENEDINFKLNTDFFTSQVDQPMLAELRADQAAGLITTMEWRTNALSAGIELDDTINTIQDLESVLELEPPMGQNSSVNSGININSPSNMALEQASMVSG